MKNSVHLFGRLLAFMLIVMAGLHPTDNAKAASHREKAQAVKSGLAYGTDKFLFSDWVGPSLQVWTYVPPGINQKTAPILFVMHGVRRDADRYRDEWIDEADKGGFIVIAPEFSQDNFPRSRNYNLGSLFAQGDDTPRDEALWSFSAIEPMFDDIVRQIGGEQTRYTIFGHSAGSQFVHRFLLLKPEVRAKRYLAANAGWYSFADLDVDFPFGLKGTPASEEHLRIALAKDVVILLGDQDTDPDHRSLNRSHGAMRQGPHRFARGQSFFTAAKALAEQQGWEFGWSLRIISDVAHSNDGMAAGAYDLVE
ncbi:alpha/beta hydrolase [Erythrobacter insulae]|uniref:Alpha/beta hydrolase n=1 Tax=Erythrobacter insulae TaxID=2584124 RepID=A0A547PD95_9SPHN|nr:alpha/beta hydrolase [Erythrobacter insulae]TRD12116.1 alpha/beta hydrolase [Erythrobacter insulae]